MKRIGDMVAVRLGLREPSFVRLGAWQDSQGRVVLGDGYLGLWNLPETTERAAWAACSGGRLREWLGVVGGLMTAEVASMPPLGAGEVAAFVAAGGIGD